VRQGVWLHVDAAYGGAAMLSARARDLFRGIERSDSVTVDPHKWLFTPFDCAAVLYREPELARRAHRQNAHYLDVANEAHADNPADYAVHLSRRARGIPFWASVQANGVEAYRDAVERCLDTAIYAAKQVDDYDNLEVVGEPTLSVVLLRRTGWVAEDYAAWSRRVLDSGLGLITPTRYDGETVLRLCFVNPLTTQTDVDLVLSSLESAG
jgi:L-2,4-diaminobutyrate decarboxylase